MRSLLFGLLMVTTSLSSDEVPEEYPSIDKEFDLLWKTKIGNASFRTNVILDNDNLIIGSNGANFMDYNFYDSESGVYILNRKNGKIKKKIAGDVIGDMDVCGTLLYMNKLYFGNDNEEFICADQNGKILWSNPTSGDIEHEPVLIDHKGTKMIVYASESGEITAVNPEDGKMIWHYYVPDYEGWKSGDNRTLFKIKAYFTNTQYFYTKPVLMDLNADGTQDMVYCSRDSKLYAINGASGKLLWNFKDESYSPTVLYGFLNRSNPLLVFNAYYYKLVDGSYESSQFIVFLDRNGKIKHKRQIGSGSYEESLNHLSISNDKMIVSGRDSLYVIKGNLEVDAINHSDKYEKGSESRLVNRNSWNEVLSNRFFPYKGSGLCFMVLNQFDAAHYDNGFIELFSLQKNSTVGRFKLNDSAEMPPIVADINHDGMLDLLVSCRDGYLYCYNMKIKAS